MLKDYKVETSEAAKRRHRKHAVSYKCPLVLSTVPIDYDCSLVIDSPLIIIIFYYDVEIYGEDDDSG